MLTKALQFLWSQLCQKDFYLPSSNVLPKMLSLKSTAVIPQASYEFSLIYSSCVFLFFFLGAGGEKCMLLQACNIRPRIPQRKATLASHEAAKSTFRHSANDLVFITQRSNSHWICQELLCELTSSQLCLFAHLIVARRSLQVSASLFLFGFVWFKLPACLLQIPVHHPVRAVWIVKELELFNQVPVEERKLPPAFPRALPITLIINRIPKDSC